MIGAIWRQTTWTDAVANRLDRGLRVSKWYRWKSYKEIEQIFVDAWLDDETKSVKRIILNDARRKNSLPTT